MATWARLVWTFPDVFGIESMPTSDSGGGGGGPRVRGGRPAGVLDGQEAADAPWV